jgi:hypothetical protein
VVTRVLVGPFDLLLLFHIAPQWWPVGLSGGATQMSRQTGRRAKLARAKAPNLWAYLIFRLISDWRCSTFAS